MGVGLGVAQPPHDQHVLDGRGRGDRLVRGGLEVHGLAPAPAAVGGDEQLRLGVLDAALERLGAEAAEDDRVRGTQPGAREHRDGQLRDHGHVDGDPVAGPHAQLLERVRGLRHLAQQVGIGDGAGVAGLTDPVVRDLVAEPVGDMPVDAVLGHVEGAAREPLGERQVPLERRLEGRPPGELLARQLRPEALEVLVGLGVQLGRGVGLRDEAGSGGKLRPSPIRFSISGIEDGAPGRRRRARWAALRAARRAALRSWDPPVGAYAACGPVAAAARAALRHPTGVARPLGSAPGASRHPARSWPPTQPRPGRCPSRSAVHRRDGGAAAAGCAARRLRWMPAADKLRASRRRSSAGTVQRPWVCTLPVMRSVTPRSVNAGVERYAARSTMRRPTPGPRPSPGRPGP